jgi:hypothetical protein
VSWLDDDKTLYPTKMFVNYLPQEEPKVQSKSLGTTLISAATGFKGIALDLLLTASPKLIDEGMKLVNNALKSMAEDKADTTFVQRNFDTIDPETLHLPSKITLIRGDFAPNKNMQGEVYGDGEERETNQAMLSGNRELEIEIDIIQSNDDPSIFYFQPNRYFHHGHSAEGERTDEVIVAFAFLPSNESTLNPSLEFKSFVHFKNLETKQEYLFKSNTGYDTSFQSSWLSVPLKEVKPYTIVAKILEIRKGNSFAKLLQTIYLENEENIQTKLNTHINHLKKGENEA